MFQVGKMEETASIWTVLRESKAPLAAGRRWKIYDFYIRACRMPALLMIVTSRYVETLSLGAKLPRNFLGRPLFCQVSLLAHEVCKHALTVLTERVVIVFDGGHRQLAWHGSSQAFSGQLDNQLPTNFGYQGALTLVVL